MLGVTFERTVKQLKGMVLDVSERAAELKVPPNSFPAGAAQAGEATSQISSTIQLITSGLAQQSDAATQCRSFHWSKWPVRSTASPKRSGPARAVTG
jgi:methyl-accepting chemotaxis protein